MFATKVAVAALSVLTVVSAGNSTFSIDVDSVTLSTRGAYFTLLLAPAATHVRVSNSV